MDIFENLDQNEEFSLNYDKNSTFLEILTKIDYLVNFEQNRDFRKN